jgi:hypothetical protein
MQYRPEPILWTERVAAREWRQATRGARACGVDSHGVPHWLWLMDSKYCVCSRSSANLSTSQIRLTFAIDPWPTLLVIKTGTRTLAEEDLTLFFTAKAVQGTLGLQRAAVARGSRRSTMPPRIGDLRRSLDCTRLGGCSSGPPVCALAACRAHLPH